MEMEQLILDDPIKFFKHVNSIRNTKDELPYEMGFKNATSTNKREIVEFFAEFFESAYTIHDQNLDNLNYVNSDKIRNICVFISSIDINEVTVLQLINELPNNLVSGSDGISNLFVKKCSRSLVKPITILLNTSLKSAIVPEK